MFLPLLFACTASTAGDSASLADSSSVSDTGLEDSGTSATHGRVPAELLPVPEFAAVNRDESARSSADLVGHPTVVWFYPAAGTLGWTVEGCGYRDRQAEFDALGVVIVGVSFDTPEANQEWAADEEFTFELWTDSDKTLALYYGSVSDESESYAGRITRLLAADGSLLLEYDEVGVTTSPQEVLEDCAQLFD